VRPLRFTGLKLGEDVASASDCFVVVDTYVIRYYFPGPDATTGAMLAGDVAVDAKVSEAAVVESVPTLQSVEISPSPASASARAPASPAGEKRTPRAAKARALEALMVKHVPRPRQDLDDDDESSDGDSVSEHGVIVGAQCKAEVLTAAEVTALLDRAGEEARRWPLAALSLGQTKPDHSDDDDTACLEDRRVDARRQGLGGPTNVDLTDNPCHYANRYRTAAP
jgi:hypothetical protein